jgi:CubicO group peptidase (beta-lactamase class C family)
VTSPAAEGSTTAVTSPARDTPTTDEMDILPPLRPGITIPAGQIDNAIAQLDTLAAEMMAKTGIPGMAVAVVHGGKVAYAKGFGVRKVGAPDTVDADTVFQLASVSKPVGATVIAHAVTEGTVAWDTPVVQHLPSFGLDDPWVTDHVTIADMYAHRSGLPVHAGDLLEDLGFSAEDIQQRLRYEPLSPFRSTYAYTNFGMTAGADAVAAAAGTDWASLSDRTLYDPLGMSSTSSRFSDYTARPNRAWTHIQQNGAWTAAVIRDPDAQSPAGGASSSVNDMAKWMIMVLGNGTGASGVKISSPEALLPAVTPQIISVPSFEQSARAGFYGYGFDVAVSPAARATFSHSGAFSAGAATNVLLLPSAGVGIVTLTNAPPTGIPEALDQQFMDLVQYGEPFTNWYTVYQAAFASMSAPFGELAGQQPPASPAPAGPDSAYVGSYTNDLYGTATVTAGAGGLSLLLGPNQIAFPLTHWDGDVFTYTPTGESAGQGSVSKVTFTRTGDTAPTSVEIEYLAQAGQPGTLTRTG